MSDRPLQNLFKILSADFKICWWHFYMFFKNHKTKNSLNFPFCLYKVFLKSARENESRGGSRLQVWLRQRSVIKALISFLNIHKLPWKSTILVHGHVRIFLKFVTFSLVFIVLIKIVQVIKNIFSETGFVINNKPPFKKENSYAWLDYVVPEIFAGVHLG